MSQLIVENSCGRKPCIVADPTLLWGFQEFDEPADIPFDSFILHYGMDEARFQSSLQDIKQIARHKGLPIVGIKSSVLQPWLTHELDFIIEDPSPEQWVWLFRRAEFVITDSFHGLLFSLKNRTEFYTYIGAAPSSERLTFVTELYGLNTKRDGFSCVETRVNEHVDESLTFLRHALGEYS